MPSNILDGTPAYGTIGYGTAGVLTLNAVAYIINSIQITPEWTSVANHTPSGIRNQKRWVREDYKATIELQLATPSTPFPPSGSTFSLTPKGESSAITFVIIDTPDDASNDPGSLNVCKVNAEEVKIGITTS